MTTQKESPPVSDHAAGVPKHNDPSIVQDSPTVVNMHGPEFVRERAATTKARLLAKAATFASLHAPNTLWSRRMKVGTEVLMIRLEWPGVLAVFDPKTGDLLARSAPGDPSSLQKQELSRQ